jgi:5-methylthioribose kinase
MKNSSFIAISVFALNMYYTKKQNKSKEKFFEYLDKGISPEEFEQELIKVWGKDNSKYIKEEITKFREQVHQENTNSKLDLSKVTLAGLGVTSLINETNKSFLEKRLRNIH